MTNKCSRCGAEGMTEGPEGTLVERLRAAAEGGMEYHYQACLVEEAAHEITRLNAALDALKEEK